MLCSISNNYYPFGMLEPERQWKSNLSYRFGYNGKEKDDDVKGSGNSLDFGERFSDPRLGGRFWKIDPEVNNYPDISPYHYSGNNPVLYVDFNGKNFGIKINHNSESKSIIIVANIYTTSETTNNQALGAAAMWNAKTVNIDGYSVSFQVNVMPPSTGFATPEELSSNKAFREGAAHSDASVDQIGNVYAGIDSRYSQVVSGKRFVGGVTTNGEHISMNKHIGGYGVAAGGDQGNKPDEVAHEIGHLFGLDDAGNTYYPGDGGIMQYVKPLNPISNADVRTVLNFARDALAGRTSETEAKVTIIEQVGSSDGSNPIGVTHE